MVTILTFLHVAVCIFLIIVVLLQQGKGADMGAAFGGSGQTVFGTDGPLPLLNKITTGSAIIFMLTSVTLAFYSADNSQDSVMESVRTALPPVEQQIEVAPTPVAVPLERAGGDGAETAPADFPGVVDAKFPGTLPSAQVQVEKSTAPTVVEPESAAPVTVE